jgi:hypothetical protein
MRWPASLDAAAAHEDAVPGVHGEVERRDEGTAAALLLARNLLRFAQPRPRRRTRLDVARARQRLQLHRQAVGDGDLGRDQIDAASDARSAGQRPCHRHGDVGGGGDHVAGEHLRPAAGDPQVGREPGGDIRRDAPSDGDPPAVAGGG